MAFFEDLFQGLTGQQATPQQTIIPVNDLVNQTYGTLNTGVAPGLVGFNQALAPGLTDVQLGVTNQIDPSILANYRGANKSILDQLNLGGGLGEELQNQVITNALQGNAATGFGVGNGGRGLVARDLGLTSLDLIRQRQADALNAGTTGLGVSSNIYNPSRYTQLGAELSQGIAGRIQGEQAARDELANVTEDIRRKNFASLINTGGRILGTGLGAAFGGAAGAQIGGNIGGSLFTGSGVAGQQQPQQANAAGGFMSLLKQLGLGTQGNYGIGSGGILGIGANPYDKGADLGVSGYQG